MKPAHRSLGSLLRFLPAALPLFLAVSPLAAHDFWIEPSTLEPAPGSRVGVRLRVGENFAGDPVPRDPARVVRFATIGPGGETPIQGVPGGEPAGYAAIGPAGTYLLVFDSNRASVDLEAQKFEDYLKLEGLEKISDLRKKRGESAKPSHEVYSRKVKSLLIAGGEPGPGFDRVLGLDLELIPEKNPSTLKPGEALPVRLLFRGKPLAGALVVAHPRSKPIEGALRQRTDAEGRVRFHLPPGEVWLVKSVNMIEAPKDANADWESFWASLTFRGPK
ncbi:MAG TPA: DUF4198 domain-containing protein [Thermoanaerobaculia bacterium]|nr:DUF4198 domain-containing protein [Thermoanaerobaculia bacterium]